MSLPVLSGAQAVAAFHKIGYQVDRQRGSHIILRHWRPPHRRLSGPSHRELAIGKTGTDTNFLLLEIGCLSQRFAALTEQYWL